MISATLLNNCKFLIISKINSFLTSKLFTTLTMEIDLELATYDIYKQMHNVYN